MTKQHVSRQQPLDLKLKQIENLYFNIKPLLDGSGIAVLLYHRFRLGLEIHLFWETHSEAFSLRDIRLEDVQRYARDEDREQTSIYNNIVKLIGYRPQQDRAFMFSRINHIYGILYIFSRENLSALEQSIEKNLPLFTLRIENIILHDVLRRNNLELELLQGTGEILSMSVKLEEVFRSVLSALDRLISFRALGIYIKSPSGEKIKEIFSVGYEQLGSCKYRETEAGLGLIGWVIQTGEPVVVPNVKEDARYIVAREDTLSELVVPMFSGNEVVGAFNIESNRVDAYTPYDLEMVSAFANQVAVSITRAKLFEEALSKSKIEDELHIARGIQKSFLPDHAPTYPGFDFDAVNISSEEVGGDYFDFIPIVDYQLGIAIADVSGHGVPASLIMAAFRASLIAEIRNNYAIRTIMHKVNNLICESVERGNFVTAVYGVLDTRNKIFTFSNAGHNPPFILRKTGQVEFLIEGGLTLGILPGREYDERPVHVNSGDIFVFYTDGVTDAENADGEQFGTDRLVKLVQEHRELPAEDIRKNLIRSIIGFKAADTQMDDLTLLLIKAE